MATSLFGTDGIRGPAGAYPLNTQGVTAIGRAIAAYFAQPGELILVGRDPRESSPALAEAMIQGLVATGALVEDVGVVPTPGLAYLIQNRAAKAGVMITASHNPYTDNGIKVFTSDGRKLSDADQTGLNEQIDAEFANRSGGSTRQVNEAIKDYQAFLVAAAKGQTFKGLKLAVDTANGATSGLAERVFSELEAEVSALFDSPDGRNINVACGATDTAALQKEVVAKKYDAGVAFDGDGDRVMLVDEQGRLLTGDHMLYILAMTGNYKEVVATQMSNMGLEKALQQHGIQLHRTAVGDRYVLAAMTEKGLTLGGEQSGHIILADYSYTGDGLLASIVTLRQVQASGQTLAQWYDELPLLPQALVNLPVKDKTLLGHPIISAYIESAMSELGKKGRLNIRPSGTEPKIRIMVEAADAESRAQLIADHLKDLLITAESPA